jgi:cyclic pyranopterin phosphate synthase
MRKRELAHFGGEGEARMVDISGKAVSRRQAVATARIIVSRKLFSQLEGNTLAKGDAFAAARIAGIQAAKKAFELIPLCHPLPITFASVDLTLLQEPPSVEITATVRTTYRTGAEMEALAAASMAALTVYDMGKSIDRSMVIESIRLQEKSGGRSGQWRR